jgi:flagellar protein FlgJ
MVSQLNALDPNALSGLKLQANDRSPEANKAVAKQFEALFLQQMLKGMRQAMASGDGPFDSETTHFYQGMYDQQLASVMAQNGGIGLAKYIERQLNGEAGAHVPTYDLPSVPGSGASQSAPMQGAKGSASFSGGNSGFVSQVWSQAQTAADSLGVPAHFLVAQAALETGWGKSVIQCADGSSSYNLFNIKAGKNWTGKTVEARTTEYENGQAVSRVERFRVYDSYDESFRDYASLVGKSSRYAAAKGQSDPQSFARALQSGGYATDPGYADKLVRIINGKTMRQGLLASNS